MGDVDGIINILNIVLIVLFSLTIAGIVIAFVRGLFRGFWKSTFYLGWYGTLLAVSFLTLGPLIEAVGNLDLTEAGLFLNITADAGVYSVPVTTIKETLHQGIALSLTLNGMAGTAAEISTAAWSITVMVLKYALFLVDIISIIILGTFFGWLLWALIFKHFIPKIVRKRVKIRIASALEGTATFIVLTGLFLAPFTSLVNIANQAWQKSEHDDSNETIKTIDRFIDTYNDSLFAKSFFNWTVGENGLTLDSQIINDITKTTVGDMETSIVETVNGLGQVGVAVAGAITVGDGQTAIDMGYILSEKTLTQVFDGLNKSQIFAYTLPLAATLALNVDQVKQYVDPNLVDMSDIDWVSEINNVETLTIDVINSGVVDSFIKKDGSKTDENSEQAPEIKGIVDSMLSEKAYPYFTRIFESIDNSKLLSRVIPSVMMHVSESVPEMADMMPKTWEEMNQLKWGSELNIVYDNLFRLNRTAPDMVGMLTTMNSGDSSTATVDKKTILYIPDEKVQVLRANEPGKGEGEGETKPTDPNTPPTDPDQNAPADTGNDTLNLIIDNIDPLTQVLIGEFDDDGKIANIDSQGHTIVYDNQGKKIPGRHYSLMDSNLFSYALPSLMDSLTSSMGEGENAFIKPEAMDKATAKLETGSILKNYKNELAALFTAFKGVANNPDLKNIMTGAGSEGMMDKVTDQKFVNKLVNLMPAFKNSQIFKYAIEPILVEQITNQDEMLSNVGLKAKDITDHLNNKKATCELNGKEDEYYDYFFDEMAFILKSMPNLLAVSDIMSDSGDTSAMFENITANAEKLALLLDTIYDSDILNPSENRSGIENNNFLGILTHLFGSDNDKKLIANMELDFETMKGDGSFVNGNMEHLQAHGSKVHRWTNTKTADGGLLKDSHGNPIYDGENGYFASALVSLGAKAKADYKPEGETANLYSKGDSLITILTKNGTDVTQIIGRLEQDFGISKVFAKVDDSTLIGKMLGSFMDKQPTLINSGVVGNGNGFSNIVDWSKEGETFGVICDSIDIAGVKLNELDVSSVKDTKALNIMLHSLADSQIFESKGDYKYNFNAFLYDKLSSAFSAGNAGSDMLVDPYKQNLDTGKTYDLAMKDFDVTTIKVEDKDVISSNINTPEAKKDWVKEGWVEKFSKYSHDTGKLESDFISALDGKTMKKEFYEGDYIARVSLILTNLNTLKENAKTASGNPNYPVDDLGKLMSDGYAQTEDLENLLQSVYKCKPLRMILYNSINLIGDIKMDDISLKEVNPDFFLEYIPYTEIRNEKLDHDVDKENNDNSKEISKIVNIYKKLNVVKKKLDEKQGQDFNLVLNELLGKPEYMVLLKEILQEVHSSQCFNLFGQSYETYDVSDPSKSVKFEYTVFQSLVDKFVLSDMILEILLDVDSPKDAAFFNKYKENIAAGETVTATKLSDLADQSNPDNVKQKEAIERSKGKLIIKENFLVPTQNSNLQEYQDIIDKQEIEVAKLIEITSSLLGGYKDVNKLATKITNTPTGDVVTVHSVNNGIISEETYEEEIGKLEDPEKAAKRYEGLKEKGSKGNTMSFDKMDYTQLTGQAVLDIMLAINRSDCLFDLAPNGLHNIMSKFGGNSLEKDSFSKALNNADPFYLYYLENIPDRWNVRFADALTADANQFEKDRPDKKELKNLKDMVQLYHDQFDEDGKMSGMLDGGLTGNDSLITDVETACNTLYQSYMFHKSIFLTKDGVNSMETRTYADATTFETIFSEFYIKTGVSKLMPRIEHQDNVITEKGKQDVLSLIVDKSLEDYKMTVKTESLTYKNTWEEEIISTFDLAQGIKDLELNSMSDFTIDLTNPELSAKLAPATVKDLLIHLNNMDISQGALNKIVEDAYKSAGFAQYVTYTNTADAIKSASNFNLTKEQYGHINLKGFVLNSEPYEIDTIYNLLLSLSNCNGDPNIKHTSYNTLADGSAGSPIKQFVASGKSTDVLLSFINDSKVYDSVINDFKGSAGEYKGKTIFFYNLLSKTGLTEFIGGTLGAEVDSVRNYSKLDTIKAIVEQNFNSKNEGFALDTIARVSELFTGGDLNFKKLNKAAVAIKGIIYSLTYEVNIVEKVGTDEIEDIIIKQTSEHVDITHGRSMLSSEIISNVIDKFMGIQQAKLTGIPAFANAMKFNPITNVNQITDTVYDRLNNTEAEAIVAIMDIYNNNVIYKDASETEIDTAKTADKFKTAFGKTGGIEWSKLMYPQIDDKYNNSYIASMVYTSELKDIVNPIVSTLKGSLTKILVWLDGPVGSNHPEKEHIFSQVNAAKTACKNATLNNNTLFNDITNGPNYNAGLDFVTYGKYLHNIVETVKNFGSLA